MMKIIKIMMNNYKNYLPICGFTKSGFVECENDLFRLAVYYINLDKFQ